MKQKFQFRIVEKADGTKDFFINNSKVSEKAYFSAIEDEDMKFEKDVPNMPEFNIKKLVPTDELTEMIQELYEELSDMDYEEAVETLKVNLEAIAAQNYLSGRVDILKELKFDVVHWLTDEQEGLNDYLNSIGADDEE